MRGLCGSWGSRRGLLRGGLRRSNRGILLRGLLLLKTESFFFFFFFLLESLFRLLFASVVIYIYENNE